jgi:lysine-N-methylase
MTEIRSYMPQFLLNSKARISQCQCVSCRAQAPLVTHAWTNHVRHSALMQCETVSREALFERDAFDLHELTAEAGTDDTLDAWQNNVNQACICLLIAPGFSIEERLYAISIMLSRLSGVDAAARDADMPLRVVEELLGLAGQGVFQDHIGQIPPIEKYKLAYLRRLARVQMRVDLDAVASMSLNLRLTELQVISDGFLVDALRDIEQSVAVDQFFGTHDQVWTNYFLYRCYHEVFPGSEPLAYGPAALDLCLDYFSIRAFCALIAACDVDLDRDVVSSVFSAWQRGGKASLGRDDHSEPLLIGLSLIGGPRD